MYQYIIIVKGHKINIVTINRKDYNSGISSGKLRKIINNEQIKLIPIPVGEKELKDPLTVHLNELGLLDTEQILLHDIYEKDIFVPLDRFEKVMQLKKHMYFSLLCQILGATELKINEININTKQGNMSFVVGGKAKNIPASIKGNYENYTKLAAELELHDIFDGNKPDIEAAKDLLYKTGLYNDTQMLSILKARSVKSNMLKTRNLKINLSSEIKSQLSVVAKLGIPKILGIETKFDKINTENEELVLNVTVKFDED